MSFLPNAQAFTNSSAPASGNTITLGVGVEVYIAIPAAGLAALTVTYPASPNDGVRVKFVSTQNVTTLTINSAGSDSFVGGPTALTANVAYELTYYKANTTWYRTQ